MNWLVKPVQPGHCHVSPEPHVVVDDELILALEHVGQPYGSVGAIEDVVGQLHHRQAAASRCDRVELTSRSLLAHAEVGEGGFPCLLVDDRRDGSPLTRIVIFGLC